MQLQLPLTTDRPDEEPALTPDEFRTLVTQLQRNASRLRSVRREIFSIQSVFISVFFLYFLGHNAWALEAFAFTIGANAVWEIYINEWRLRSDNSTAQSLSRFVMDTSDAEQLGTILDLYETAGRLGDNWKMIHEAAGTAVGRLLPLVRTADTNALNTQQRARLRRSLFSRAVSAGSGSWPGADYCLAVLFALKQIGDKRDLQDVERVMQDEFHITEVRAAAERCAQVIRKRIASEEDKDVLLRADRRPEAVQILLRPSIENPDTPPQQLLRAATSDEGNTPA